MAGCPEPDQEAPGGPALARSRGRHKESALRISGKRLALGAGITALLFAGAAPLAMAAGPVPQPPGVVPPFCSTTSLPPSGGQTPGEGMIVAGATSGATADITCNYASTAGVKSHAIVSSLNAWELTRSGTTTPICAQGNLTGGAAPKVECDYVGGGTITLTVHAAGDTTTGLGGASVQAVAGGIAGAPA